MLYPLQLASKNTSVTILQKVKKTHINEPVRGAIIESMQHHGQGVYSGTFSGKSFVVVVIIGRTISPRGWRFWLVVGTGNGKDDQPHHPTPPLTMNSLTCDLSLCQDTHPT